MSGETMNMADQYIPDRSAATAHARIDGHEALCIQEAKHTQKALDALTDAIKTFVASTGVANSRLHARIDKLMWGMGGLILSAAGGLIFLLAQWLWEAVRYKG